MTADDSGVALARQALHALRRLDDQGPRLAPDGADRFSWAADVLDELARCSDLIAAAVGHTSGVPSATVARRAADLTTAIVAHRNTLLYGGERPFRRSGDGGRGVAVTAARGRGVPVGLLASG